MPTQRRERGRAVEPIVDEATGEVLGWTYRWDNGETSQIMAADMHPGLARERDQTDAQRE